MTRERWEQILFAHVSDETAQDMLNQYVLELESENAELRTQLADVTESMGRVEKRCAKLRELCADMWSEGMCECGSLGKCERCIYDYPRRMHGLGIEVDA